MKPTAPSCCVRFFDRLPFWSFCWAAACLALLPNWCQGFIIYQSQTTNVMGGEYTIGGNVWGAVTRQQVTAYADQTFFEVTLSEHNNTSGVAAYPHIFKGSHWGGPSTVNSGFPIQVSDVASAPFEVSIDTTGVSGTWNAAFESFFSSTGDIVPDKAELMIWLDRNGNFYPAGSRVARNVNIGGILWDVYHSTAMEWDHYIAYVLPSLTSSVSDVSLDLKDFMNDSQARGYLDTNWYLDSMEMGFEIIKDGTGLTLNSYSAQVIPVAGVPGDYNEDGIVDVLDYIFWRNSLGAGATSLPNDDTPGIGEDDFLRWKEHFGETAGAGALAGSTVPEPSSIVLMLGSLVALALLRRIA